MSKLDQKKRNRRHSNSDSDDDQVHSKKLHADGYDDKYRGDADDRAWLKTLTERQREEELLKRHEQREALTHREEITKKLRSKQKSDDENTDNETTKTKSNTYDDDIYAEDDDDYRSSANRRKQVNASKQKETQHNKSLQALIEERKKKNDEKVKKTLPKSDDLTSSDDETTEKLPKSSKEERWKVTDVYDSGSEQEDDDDDDDEDTHSQRSRSPDDRETNSQKQEIKRKQCTHITTKSQLKSMVLSRFRMEKWCHAPFFANVAKGAFVRINIGQNNGKPVYRVCEIRDVVETGKVYNLGSTRTNKGLRLKHGHNERVFRLEYVSNSEISDAEFQRWRETTIKQGASLPTLENLENKIKEIDKWKHYVYSNKDISKIVEEKGRFRKVPINYAMTKNELNKEIEIAKDEENIERENELRKQLNEMEERATELDRRRSGKIAVITQINRRNRKSTQQNVEMALAREAQEQKNAASDPFTRRRCAPILVSKAPQTKEELIRELQRQRATDEAATAKRKAEEQRLLAEKNKPTTSNIITDKQTLTEKILPSTTTHERGSFTSFSEKNDDLFSSHDFELDIALKIISGLVLIIDILNRQKNKNINIFYFR